MKQSLILILLIFAASIVIGCGKKPEEDKEDPIHRHIENITELEQQISKQRINCQPGQLCPNYISKLAVMDRKGPSIKYCTGFLVSNNVMATSSSCLPDQLRLNDLDCSKDVFFFFPETNSRPAERIGCKRVLQASSLSPKGDPTLWRDDVSFLELVTPVTMRGSLSILREGFPNQKSFRAWGVDQLDDGYNAVIKRQDCEVVHGSYINPFSSNEASPNMLFADCRMKKEMTGAPIIDTRGKVRGMISSNVPEYVLKHIRDSQLRTEPLRPMLLATNFACAPTIYDTNVMDERECSKFINNDKMIELRMQMLASSRLFEGLRKKLEDKVSDASKYFNFSVKLLPSNGVALAEIRPKCFKNISKWVRNLPNGTYSFKGPLPKISFKVGMDEYGKVAPLEVPEEDEQYFFQFSTKTLKQSARSYVLMWNENVSLNFPAFSENCQ